MGLLTIMPTALEPTGTDSIAVSTSIPPAGEGPEEREAVFLSKEEHDFTTQEKDTTHPPRETSPHPTAHRASTARATTAQAPATSHSHRAMQPDHHETSAPTGPGHLDPRVPSGEDRGPSATEKADEDGAVTQFPAGEGSGESVSVCPLWSSAFPGTLGGLWVKWPLVPSRAQSLGVGAQVGHLTHSAPCVL